MARPAACALCGRDIEPHDRGSRPACCKRCIAKTDREIARMPRVDCRECGKALSTRTRAARYCSDACRSPAARRARAEGRRKYAADPEKRALQLARLRRSAAARGARERGDKRPPRASRGVKSPKPSQGSDEPYPCALCGRYFAPHGGRGRRQVHCKRCRAKADKEIGRERAQLQGVRHKVFHVEPRRPLLPKGMQRRRPEPHQPRERPQAHGRPREARRGSGAHEGAVRRQQGREKGRGGRAAERAVRIRRLHSPVNCAPGLARAGHGRGGKGGQARGREARKRFNAALRRAAAVLYHFELQMAGVVLLTAMAAGAVSLWIKRRRERAADRERAQADAEERAREVEGGARAGGGEEEIEAPGGDGDPKPNK